MMFKTSVIAAGAIALGAVSANAAVVGVDDSTATTPTPWIGFMNVSDLPADGGGFVFGSGWGTADLNASFDDGAAELTLSPNTIGDPNEFWYQNTSGTAPDPVNPGGPGQLGNKSMEANLFREFPEGSPDLAALVTDGTLTFEGDVLSNSFTSAHTAVIFIKEFGPGFSAPVETTIPMSPGAFSLSVPVTGAGGTVQFGFRVTGENVWLGDEGPFGAAVIGTVPEPASALLIAAGAGLIGLRRRR